MGWGWLGEGGGGVLEVGVMVYGSESILDTCNTEISAIDKRSHVARTFRDAPQRFWSGEKAGRIKM